MRDQLDGEKGGTEGASADGGVLQVREEGDTPAASRGSCEAAGVRGALPKMPRGRAHEDGHMGRSHEDAARLRRLRSGLFADPQQQQDVREACVPGGDGSPEREQAVEGSREATGLLGVRGGLSPKEFQADDVRPGLRKREVLALATCPACGGVSARVDQLRALGNAVVPAQAAAAFRILAGRIVKR